MPLHRETTSRATNTLSMSQAVPPGNPPVEKVLIPAKHLCLSALARSHDHLSWLASKAECVINAQSCLSHMQNHNHQYGLQIGLPVWPFNEGLTRLDMLGVNGCLGVKRLKAGRSSMGSVEARPSDTRS